MEKRIKILVGVPCYKPYEEFIKSLSAFLQLSSLKYDISCYMVYGKQLVDAQNDIGNMFINGDYDYLLLTEDDIWGHTVEMLDDLIAGNADVISMKYFSRHYPYVVIPIPKGIHKEDGKFQMNIIGCKDKYADSGLLGFGMTLIKRKVFIYLDKPYFNRNKKEDGTDCEGYATDQDFAERTKAWHFVLKGCFSHCLTHRGLNEQTVVELRDKGLAGTGKYKNYQDFAIQRIIAKRRDDKKSITNLFRSGN
jgi:hypothetical protein